MDDVSSWSEYEMEIMRLRNEIEEYCTYIKKLEVTLKFYANPSNWAGDEIIYDSSVGFDRKKKEDGGELARRTLNKNELTPD